MRLLIYSDLHNEFELFEPDPRLCHLADVIVLAGDIDLHSRGVEWAKTLPGVAKGTPVVMVAGNHEFYGGDFDQTLVEMRQAAVGSNVHVLENDSLILDDVRFLGCTLWTDFQLNGEGEPMHMALEAAQRSITDFYRITAQEMEEPTSRRLHPLDTVRRHHHSRHWLAHQLTIPFAGPTVVVTHHAPSSRSIAPVFQGGTLSPAFASDLEQLMGPPVALWVHGHVHDSFDYEIVGTRVICNPRGYLPDEPNPGFTRGMFVEV